MSLFENIQKIAKQHGFSLRSLNEKAKLGTNAIYKWKTQTPSTEKLKAVADVLGVSVDYLLGNTNEMHTNKVTPSVTDLEDMLDSAITYGGKSMSDNDRTILKGMLKAYFDNKEK